MKVYLVRHGIAENRAMSGKDVDRRLTTKGRKHIRRIARVLARLDVKPDVVLTSPYPRAAETASLIAAQLDCAGRVKEIDELRSGAGGEVRIWHLLNADYQEVMIVGHEPEMSLIAATLAGEGTHLQFKKGSVCCIDLPDLHGTGQVMWLLPPKIAVAFGKALSIISKAS